MFATHRDLTAGAAVVRGLCVQRSLRFDPDLAAKILMVGTGYPTRNLRRRFTDVRSEFAICLNPREPGVDRRHLHSRPTHNTWALINEPSPGQSPNTALHVIHIDLRAAERFLEASGAGLSAAMRAAEPVAGVAVVMFGLLVGELVADVAEHEPLLAYYKPPAEAREYNIERNPTHTPYPRGEADDLLLFLWRLGVNPVSALFRYGAPIDNDGLHEWLHARRAHVPPFAGLPLRLPTIVSMPAPEPTTLLTAELGHNPDTITPALSRVYNRCAPCPLLSDSDDDYGSDVDPIDPDDPIAAATADLVVDTKDATVADVVSLYTSHGAQHTCRQVSQIRKIWWAWRCFVKGAVPAASRRHLLVRAGSPLTYIRLLTQVVNTHVTGGPSGNGVPRNGFYRPVPKSVCGDSGNYCIPGYMATPADFAAHSESAIANILHYHTNGAALLQMAFGVPLAVVQLCSGAGGAGADLHLDGYVNMLLDILPQPDASDYYGADAVLQGNALDLDVVRRLAALPGVVAMLDSPDCTAYSHTARLSGGSPSPALFRAHTAMSARIANELLVPTVTESVMSALPFTDPETTVVMRAIFLGLRTIDPHCFQGTPGYCLHMDLALSVRGRWLAKRSCVGEYRRLPRIDYFGLPMSPCCYRPFAMRMSIHGASLAPGVTMTEARDSVGVQHDHTDDCATLSNMLPPRMGRAVVAEMGMLTVHHRWQLPLISHDAALADGGLLQLHEAATKCLDRLPRVKYLRELKPLVPHVTTAVLMVVINTRVLTCRQHNKLPRVTLEPGDWVRETAFDLLDSNFGIYASRTAVRFCGFVMESMLTAVFATDCVVDNLYNLWDVTPPDTDPQGGDHTTPEGLHVLGADTTKPLLHAVPVDQLANSDQHLIEWWLAHDGDRHRLLADSSTRMASLVNLAVDTQALAARGRPNDVQTNATASCETSALIDTTTRPEFSGDDVHTVVEDSPLTVDATPVDGTPTEPPDSWDVAETLISSQTLVKPAADLTKLQIKKASQFVTKPLTDLLCIVVSEFPGFSQVVYTTPNVALPNQLAYYISRHPSSRSALPADLGAVQTFGPSFRWYLCRHSKLVPLQAVDCELSPFDCGPCLDNRCTREAWTLILGLAPTPAPLSWTKTERVGAASCAVSIALTAATSLIAAIPAAPHWPELPMALPIEPDDPHSAVSIMSVRALVQMQTDSLCTASCATEEDTAAYAARWLRLVSLEARTVLAACAAARPTVLRRWSLKPQHARLGQVTLVPQDRPPDDDGSLQCGTVLRLDKYGVLAVIAVRLMDPDQPPKFNALLYRVDPLAALPPESGGACATELPNPSTAEWLEVGSIQPMLLRVHGLTHLGDCDPGLRRLICQPIDPDRPPVERTELPWRPLRVCTPLASHVHPLVGHMHPVQQAVLSDLSQQIVAVQGPPGAGKSTFIAGVCSSCVFAQFRMIVTAPSNKAVEAIVRKLIEWKIAGVLTVGNRLRMGPVACSRLIANVVDCSDKMAAFTAALLTLQAAAADVQALTCKGISTHPVDLKVLQSLKDRSRELRLAHIAAYAHTASECIRGLRVLVCTTSSALSATARLARNCRSIGATEAAELCKCLRFEAAIADEAGGTLECETWFSLFHGARACILVGDPAQLRPTADIATTSYVRSMLERLMDDCVKWGDLAYEYIGTHLLSVQYRMPPIVGSLVSELSYDGRLSTAYGNSCSSRPLFVVHVEGECSVTSTGAVSNCIEADAVASAYIALVRRGVAADRIQVITFYAAQRTVIEAAASGACRAAVATVDSMQGSENDIILCCPQFGQGLHH